jgi:hypothetical protein
MNKIISALLQAKYPTMDTNALLEVINATPNAPLATELLCGLYEEPKVPAIVFNKDKNADCTMTSYDKWTDRVHYSYYKEKTISIYVPKRMDTSVITLENYKEYQVEYKSGEIDYFNVKTGEVVEATDYCYLENWLKYHNQ